MLSLTAKSLQHVQSFVAKLEQGTFEERDVTSLLTSIRFYFRKYGLLWELAAFEAHQNVRDKGISHASIDVNYAKFLYVHANDGSRRLPTSVVPSKLYRTLFINAVEDFDDDTLRQECGMGKTELNSLVRENYTDTRNGSHVLEGRLNVKGMFAGLETILRTVAFKAAIPQQDLISQLVEALLEVHVIHPFSYDFEALIRANEDDILVCMICLIHSARVKLFDGSQAECFISTHLRRDTLNPKEFKLILAANYQFRIGGSNFSSSLLETIGEASRYLKGLDERSIIPGRPLPKFNAIRDHDGDLVLG